ncbi:MAG: DEAD/DEAH box helicase family protein [Candidatus Thermoplasmatota archaeon]|nr:DEAD/DEAH box helicase family protein [Candidatus Thermoplasmatota archaeon]
MFLEHDLITPSSIEFREYQSNIAHAALDESTLVVLPTGMGKTIVALFVIAEVLKSKRGRVLFMAPTKPLVEQHAKFLRENLVGHEPVVFTGEVAPEERKSLWTSGRLIVSTPQVVANDLGSDIVDISEIDLIVFDEAHRAAGDYAYVTIGKAFMERGGLALGMTASPGSDVSKIAEVCENLGITWVEIRSESDDDVVEYIQQVKTEFIGVGMQEGMSEIVSLLKKILDEQVAKLRAAGLLDPKKPITTRDLLAVGATIRAQLDSGKKSYNLFSTASVQALAMKVNHGIELAETQGRGALENYLDKQVKQAEENKRSKASRTLVKDVRFQQAREHLYKMVNDHPKLYKLIPILRTQFAGKPESRAIVFTHYRDTCDHITKRLETIEGVRPVRFVGQASKGEDIGLKQKEQREVLESFQEGKYNTLVATSIAEEGLDIPATDLVVFYEPVPSEIRTIQRRGRTGRRQAGRVIVLVTKGTKDEAYLWSSRKKEMQMRRELDGLRRKLRAHRGLPEKAGSREPLGREDFSEMMAPHGLTERGELSRKTAERPGQKSLPQYGSQNGGSRRVLKVSGRIAGTATAAGLEKRGFLLEDDNIETADVVVSDRVAVTIRTVQEFICAISDGTMFSHLNDMKRKYQHPVLIVQGPPEGKGVQAGNAAIYDALGTLLSEFRMPVLSTLNVNETVGTLSILRSQEEARGGTGRTSQTTLDRPNRPIFLVQGLPNVSATLAQRLLDRFGSVDGIADATPDQLTEVEGVGRVIAEGIHTVMQKRFD